ncbi:MAG TPA: T9SS type A sorting domain-containing protein, partial [Bacteroidales bacterium]
VDWTGNLGTDWNTKGNWDGLYGYIPDASFNVNIPNMGNDPSISAETAANDISLESGANLTLEADKWLTVFGNLDILAGNMAIQSSAMGEGSLITYGNVSGEADIERIISDGEWHLVSSPVSGATANVFYGEYLQVYDEPSADWIDIESETDPLAPMKGYALWGIAPLRITSYTFTGTPYSGNQSYNFTNLNTGWNLIGNPYPSGIDWDTVAANLPSGLNNAIYYLDAATGDYKSYVDGTGDGSPFIPAMQGFWVSASAGGTLTLKNADRTHQGSSLYYKNDEILSNYIELLAARDSDFDQTFIRFRNAASAGFDGKYDAYKLMAVNQNFPQLFTYAGNDILSVNQLPEVEVMDLGFYCGSSGTYTILLAEMNGIANCMLEDLKTGNMQNLKMGSYTFSYTAGEPEKRFKLHFGPTSVTQTNAGESILIYSKGKTVFVVSKNVIQNSQLQITDLSGRVLFERTIDNQQTYSLNTGLKSGIYLLTLSGQGSVKTEKVMIE